MAVTSADLTYPPGGTGEIRPDWFSGEDLADLLAVWIAAGEALVPSGGTPEQSDRLVTAYAYWKAYDAKAALMAGAVNSLSIDGGDLAISYAKDQRDFFIGKASFWRLAYEAALAEEESGVVIDNPPRSSYSQPIAFSF